MPTLIESSQPDWIVRRRRSRRQIEPGTVFVVTIPYPVDRSELVELLRRRFPAFTVDSGHDGPEL